MPPDIIVDVPLSEIRFDESQPRAQIDPDELLLLEQSMHALGRTVQLITVARREDGTYMLLSGERRVRAAQSLRWHHLPAVVVDEPSDPRDRFIRQVAENTARATLQPTELCVAIARLKTSSTPAEIAAAVGLSLRTVYNYLSILEYPHLVVGLRQGRTLRSVLAEAAALAGNGDQGTPTPPASPSASHLRRSVSRFEAAWPSLDDATRAELAGRLRRLLSAFDAGTGASDD